MWIAGSVAEGYADELSDVDLWLDVDDGKEEELSEFIEAFLESKGELDVRLGLSLEPPYTHRVYHLKGTNPYHFIEFTLHTHSHEHDFDQGARKIKILFDKDGTIKTKPFNKEAHAIELQTRKQSLIYKIEVGYLSVEKEIIRGQFMDAMHNYEFWLVEPVIELARIKHSPLKTSYGLKHGSRDLPKETADEIQSLYTIKSLDDLRNKIEEVKAMVKKYS
jgi:predicted nucleotidyltransferase